MTQQFAGHNTKGKLQVEEIFCVYLSSMALSRAVILLGKICPDTCTN